MANNTSFLSWLNQPTEQSSSSAGPWVGVGVVGLAYFIGMLFAIGAALEIISRHDPEESYILPRCLNRRYLRFPSLCVWPGLLWPIFLVVTCLRQRRNRRRANAPFQDGGSNGNPLSGVRNNEGTATPPPPTYQSVDQDHHGPEEGGE